MTRSQKGAITTINLADDESTLFVTSDLHVDSICCDRSALFADIEEAKRRNALIMFIGDIFDAMNGRFDPRRNMDELRPEYRCENYFDKVVTDVAQLLSPYAANIALISDGNHELSILKHNNTNLTDRLVHELNTRYGGNIIHGGYGGWVRLQMKTHGSGYQTIRMKYFHGSGGEAPVTRGTIQTSRQAVYLPDAHIVVNGHSHNQYHLAIARERLSGRGTLFFDIQHHIRTPGYKQAYGDGSSGWDVMRGGVPKPLGGCWLQIETDRTARVEQPRITVTPQIHNPVVL